jgi:polysaccharide deacetylase family protein (PEP-CTERM system associated)
VSSPLASQSPLAAFTVDVEDYFHVSGFAEVVPTSSWPERSARVEVGLNKLLELLDRHQVRGTFFILGWVADHQPQLVRRIAELGHELGSHSYAHQLVYRQTMQEFREDLRRSREVIEQATGQRVTIYRAPSFSIVRDSLWALEVLVEEGFTIDSSIFPIWHDRYGIPDAETNPCEMRNRAGTIVEFPPTVWELGRLRMPVGGGGLPQNLSRAGDSRRFKRGRAGRTAIPDLRASLGTRSRAAPTAGALALEAAALPQPRQDGNTAGAALEKPSVRNPERIFGRTPGSVGAVASRDPRHAPGRDVGAA